MGVDINRVQPGDGKTFPQPGQTVICHYTGTFTNGQKFDSSVDRGKPFEFKLGAGQVIKGFDEAFSKMSVGEKARLTVPPEWAHGANGLPPTIPPNSTLVFDAQLMNVK